MRGVYSWLTPSYALGAPGVPHTVAYASDENGYRAANVDELGLKLPAFPKSLYSTNIKYPAVAAVADPASAGRVEDDMVVIEAAAAANQARPYYYGTLY